MSKDPPELVPETPEQASDSEPVAPGRTDGAAQAKAAMERARDGARNRGTATRSAGQAHRERRERQREAGVDPAPYGAGREARRLDGEIQRFFDGMGWTEQVEVGAITARWREVVGDVIADHCTSVEFMDGTLAIRATSTAWAQQLTLMAGEIRHRLNEEVGRSIVTDVKVSGPTGRSWTKGIRTVKGRGPRDTYG